MTLTDFQSLASGLQSIAVVGAAILGGLWALYRFRNLREVEKNDAEIKRAQRLLQESGALKCNIKTRLISDPTNALKYLVVCAEFTNVGTRSETLHWETGGASCAQLKEFKEGVPILNDVIFAKCIDEKGLVVASIIAPGESFSAEILVQCPAQGINLVSVTVKGSDTEISDRTPGQPGWAKRAVWGASKWVVIE